jgi:hypothetical protein
VVHAALLNAQDRTLLLASTECAISLRTAPRAPVSTAKPGAIVAYAAAARLSALRTAAALRRGLALRSPPLRRVLDDYDALVRVDSAAAASAAPGATASSSVSLVAELAQAEQRAALDSLAARVPACAPPISSSSTNHASP